VHHQKNKLFTRLIYTGFLSVSVACLSDSCTGLSRKVTRMNNGLRAELDSTVLSIEVIRPDIIRITESPLSKESHVSGYSPAGRISPGHTESLADKGFHGDSGTSPKSLIVVDREPEPCVFKVKSRADKVILTTDILTVKLDLSTGQITFIESSGKTLLETGGRTLESFEWEGKEDLHVRQDFNWNEGEALYGLGQHQDGIMNWRGHRVELWQSNMVAVTPVLVSSEGYGILWDNCSYSIFSDTEEGSFLWSESAARLDYYFIYGPEPDQVVSGYRKLTGKAPMFPKWAYGYIQSRERYKTQAEILDVVKEYRERKIPLDVIVLDWQYWEGDQWGQKSFDPERFPDPGKMMDELHNIYNARLMISIWPKLAYLSPDFMELKQHEGYLYEPEAAQSLYDAFNEGARNLYWKQANEGLFRYGIDAWWCDATEPELRDWDWAPEHYRDIMKPAIGTGIRYMNAYSLQQAKGIYENQRKTNPDKRVFNLTRSAMAGQQRYGAATWSGDVTATWEVFRKQISGGLNFCIAGIPYWTTDIGAFFVNGISQWRMDRFVPDKIKDENYKELYVRWFQFGTFCPLFRSHGTDLPREVWKFGEPGDLHYDVLVRYDYLRYRLMPYIYSLAGMVSLEDYTIMRPLVMDFRNDPKVYDIDRQFMFGPAIMVCPVTEPGVTEWEVYLPENEGGWYDFHTGEHFAGGQTVQIPVSLNDIPLFVRAGSIIPMGGMIEYAGQADRDPMEIRIYPGRDGSFVLYDDQHDGYAYEDGAFSLVTLNWNDAERKLRLAKREGSFPGMAREMRWHPVIVSAGKGTGPERIPLEGDALIYKGSEFVTTLLKMK
jgi:alpha-D-xyloside xylohydrolase